MSTSYLKSNYELFAREGQSFKDYVLSEIELCTDRLNEALLVAPKNHQGKPVFYTILRHVSRSGMSRCISIHYFDTRAGEFCQLNYPSAVILGYGLDAKHEAIRINGAGMDMGFALIYALAEKLLGDGYAIEQRWV